MSSVVWTAPGPGTWERDQSHFAPTVSRLMIEIMQDAGPRGIREGFDLVGAPLDSMDVGFVNGQMYRRLVPIIGGGAVPRKPPPNALVRAVFAVHPRLRRRVATAAAVFEERSWNAEADRWENEWKPALVATNRRLASVDVEHADDAILAEHLVECLEHITESFVLHFRLHVSDLGPVGRLLEVTGGWGLDPTAVMAALAGASPATSEPKDALRPIAQSLADRGIVANTLDDVRAAGHDTARLLNAYLIDFGSRLTTGYDLVDKTLAELPGVILATLTDPALLEERSSADQAAERGDAALAVIREQVAPGERPAFDELVSDARRLYGLRDENGPLTVEWPAGVVRRALLEAGRRFVRAGRLIEPVHVMNLSGDELRGMMRGEVGPRAQAVATRDEVRRSQADLDSPAYLGPAPVEPDLDALPAPMRDLMRISMSVFAMLEAPPQSDDLTGTGIGAESYVGTARVVTDASDALDRVEPGDVVVARFTVPTFNSVLAMAGAVVTEHGGLLCHTAVIARELGIAGVVGVSGALDIADGSTIEVDPVAGTVTVVE